jgi:hypothetical protein
MKPVLVHRDRSGKFVSRRPAGARRRRFRRNPENDPGSVEAEAILGAMSAGTLEDLTAEDIKKAQRKAASRRGAAARAEKAAKAAKDAAATAEQKAEEAAILNQAARAEADAALQAIYKAEEKRAKAEAQKAQAEAKKAQAEAKKAEAAATGEAATPRAPRRRRAPSSKLSARAAALSKRARSLKDTGLRSVYRQRASALRLRERARKGKMSKRAKEAMRAHGLTRVNPGFKNMFADLKILVPKMLAVGASAWAVSKVGSMASGSLFKDTESPLLQKYGNTIAVGGATILSYLAARMIAPKYASAVLMGGTAATVVHALVATKYGEPPRSAGNYLFPNALQGYVALNGAPSATEFASPSAMEILDAEPAGSLSGSVFD